jgi:hypothetical protein
MEKFEDQWFRLIISRRLGHVINVARIGEIRNA